MTPTPARRHISELHALAARLGVQRYRMLRRDELVSEIEARGGEAEVPPGERPRPEGGEPKRRREAPRRGDGADDATEQVTGVIEVLPQRYGFLRVAGLDSRDEDVYVSAAQIRRCELRTGDEVSGPAREARRGERHRALVHVDRVNGEEPVSTERPGFDERLAVRPEKRVPLDGEPSDVLARAVDLLAPLALGQRVLVRAAPRSGRTGLLRAVARGAAEAGAEVVVLLVDERPEEATSWRRAAPEAEFAIATADQAPAEQVRIAQLALERARRRAESGADVALIVDSLSRLAFASGDAAEVKRVFGSGRNLEGEGSLTVVATLVEGARDDGQAERAVITTESSLISLDPKLAAEGVYPALRVAECRVADEEALRGADELIAVRRLRSLLGDLESRAAADLLRERIEGTPSNAELLASL